jgi:hypothetical protein
MHNLPKKKTVSMHGKYKIQTTLGYEICNFYSANIFWIKVNIENLAFNPDRIFQKGFVTVAETLFNVFCSLINKKPMKRIHWL